MLNITLSENKTLDLSKAPHMLIAGQTGSGKSVCINAILCSLIRSYSPSELRLILIDPKVVELQPYSDIPHLLFPIVTEVSMSKQVLNWAVNEMESRYQKLALEGVRNLDSYNALEGVSEKLPSIVIVIDEFADLMYQARKEIETQIIRIAQKARAVGIHLILATQRPSVNVITGILKANIPTRIAFQVASQIDARTIMDVSGAELLKGNGDGLLKGAKGEIESFQGSFVSDMDVERTCMEAEERYQKVDLNVSETILPSNPLLDEVIARCEARRAAIQKRI